MAAPSLVFPANAGCPSMGPKRFGFCLDATGASNRIGRRGAIEVVSPPALCSEACVIAVLEAQGGEGMPLRDRCLMTAPPMSGVVR